MTIDLRSDTFTKPTPGMLNAMMAAEVGDDVFGEDPTINRLEETVAGMFGKEAALYCPTGTMSNQIAIKCHTLPGDEVICEKSAHVFSYEGGGMAFNSLCQARTLDGERGRINASHIEAAINPDDVHKARTSLVCLENTSNRGGGSCYDMEEMEKIRQVCTRHKLGLHLDGARLFNALVAKKQTPEQYGQVFDTISICFNKGLGCPIGSVLTGSAEFIKKARRVRKVFGGGMRQAGFMAASALYALQHNVERLELDHMHAKQLAAVLLNTDFIENVMPVETNIVIMEIKAPHTAREISDRLKEHDILALPISANQIRMVTHLDVPEELIRKTVAVIEQL